MPESCYVLEDNLLIFFTTFIILKIGLIVFYLSKIQTFGLIDEETHFLAVVQAIEIPQNLFLSIYRHRGFFW